MSNVKPHPTARKGRNATTSTSGPLGRSAPRKKTFINTWTVLALWLSTMGGSVTEIVMLQNQVQQRHDGQEVIADLQTEVATAGRIQMSVYAGDVTAREGASQSLASKVAVRSLIAKLQRAAPASEVTPITSTVNEYENGVASFVDLWGQGRTADAKAFDLATIDPLETKVAGRLSVDYYRFTDQADSAETEAKVGTVVTFGIASVFLGLIGLVLKRSLKSSMALEANNAVLGHSERRLSSLIQNVSDLIALVDEHGRIVFASPASMRILGREPGELMGRLMLDAAVTDDRQLVADTLRRANSSRGALTQHWRMKSKSGAIAECEVTLVGLLNDPNVRATLVTLRDVTAKKQLQQELSHQAFHDALTGLPNRALFNERLTLAVDRTHRTGKQAGVVFLDLDNFKVVNDSMGHDQGDCLLQEFAERLKTATRPFDTVARLGGDEFTILFDEVESEADLALFGDRLLATLREPIRIMGREIFASASIGLAMSTGDSTAESLLREADVAMYHAKANGKRGYAIFNEAMNTNAMERLELENDLRSAIEKGELHLVYQPICSVPNGETCGVEALLRWTHATRGVIPVQRIIAVAEETGLIVQLGQWVLRTACQSAAGWIRHGLVKRDFVINVNVSVRQLADEAYVSTVLEALSSAGLKAENLKLELTESMLVENSEDCVMKMTQLRELGVLIAIDDFGTGYSSMSYLNSLPVDTLKIDQSFISRVHDSEESDVIINAIITMAHALGLKVTGEGIETEEQLQFLKSLECDQVQGYLFAKPLSTTDIEAYLAASGRPLTAKQAA